MPIRQLYEIVGGVSNSWIKSMRDGEKAANDLRDATGKAGDSMDDMGDSAQGASGIFGRFTKSIGAGKAALLGAAGAAAGLAAAFAGLASSARQTLYDMQEMSLFVPQWDLSQVSHTQRALERLGLSTQRTEGIFDAFGEAGIRIAEGQFELGSSIQSLLQQVTAGSADVGEVLGAIRSEYARTVAEFGQGEAFRRLDESFGGQGRESLTALFAIADVGQIERAFQSVTGLTESQINALNEARDAQTRFNQTMAVFQAEVLRGLKPVIDMVAGISTWIGENETLVKVLRASVIPTVGILGLAIVGLGAKAVAAGIAASVAWAPFLPVLLGVGAAIGGIALVIQNWEGIWNGISRAMKSVWDFLSGIVDLLKQAIGYAKDFYESPAFYLVPGVGQAKLAGDIGGGIASGVGSAASFVTNTFSSAPSTSTTMNRSSNVTINVTSESEESLAETVREGLEESEERSI